MSRCSRTASSQAVPKPSGNGGSFKSPPEETPHNQVRIDEPLRRARQRKKDDWSSSSSSAGMKKLRPTESCRCIQHRFRVGGSRISSGFAEANKWIMNEDSMQEAQNKLRNQRAEKRGWTPPLAELRSSGQKPSSRRVHVGCASLRLHSGVSWAEGLSVRSALAHANTTPFAGTLVRECHQMRVKHHHTKPKTSLCQESATTVTKTRRQEQDRQITPGLNDKYYRPLFVVGASSVPLFYTPHEQGLCWLRLRGRTTHLNSNLNWLIPRERVNRNRPSSISLEVGK